MRVVREAAKALRKRLGGAPRAALLVGAGHTVLAEQLQQRIVLSPDELPPGVEFANRAPLLGGLFEGVPIVLSDPLVVSRHGVDRRQITFPIRVLRSLGADLLILSAGGASLDSTIDAGTVVALEDHINFAGTNPLGDAGDDDFGPRFPDLSAPYCSRLREIALRSARQAGVPCAGVVYGAIAGPSLPTRAEYRFYRQAGAEVIGTSLVQETIAAVHAGFDVLALAGITQAVPVDRQARADQSIAAPDDPAGEAADPRASASARSIERMLDAADLAAPRTASIVAGVIRSLTH